MINFRYHIVSLVAVFLALAVGIVVGVSLRPTIDEGLAQQAAQDRKTVQDLRAQIDRQNALNDYRDAYAEQVGPVVTAGVLSTYRVALVTMPDAPRPVVDALTAAVDEAGGQLTSVSAVEPEVFDPDGADEVIQALSAFAGELGLTDAMSPGMKTGVALARAVATSTSGDVDPTAQALTRAMVAGGLATVDRSSDELAQLVLVVTAPAAAPAADPPDLSGHAEFALALGGRAVGVVVGGPNSTGLTGTDVAEIRRSAAVADVVSTVDVADLPSGVSTMIVAGKEQLLGRHGHYGALPGADGPAPELPVR
jgi:Copper transport outer membrane protein, MctB